MLLLLICTLFVIIGTSVCLYIKWIENYWDRRGLFTYRPKGNIVNIHMETYKELKAKGLKHGGNISFFKPYYMNMDLEVIKSILIKDFDHFSSHGFYNNEKDDPLSTGLLSMEGETWKKMRSILSPVFSTGKIRGMFPLIAHQVKILTELLENKFDSESPIDAKDIATRYTLDAVGSCAFGIELNTMTGSNQDFKKAVNEAITIKWKRLLENLVNHDILRFLHFKTVRNDTETYFRNLINYVIAFRERNNIERNDLFQYLLSLTNTGKNSSSTVTKQLSSDQMASQLYSFFIGGFETSSILISFILFELALNQDIQNKLRNEINESIGPSNELLCEKVMEMEYLDKVMQETLRKHPPVPSTNRLCTKSYEIPDLDFTLRRGETVSIPIYAIQHDPIYYPDPEKFDPERFTPEKKASRDPMTFLSFGGGPRICIGFRLAQVITKTAIAGIVSKFKVTLDKKTKTPIKYTKSIIMLKVDGGIWINLEKLQK